MTLKSPKHSYIYSFNYDYHHEGLCKLESRQIFDKEQTNKLLFSTIKANPSISPFIRSRLDIISSSESYSELLKNIRIENIHIEGFKAEYLILDGDSTAYSQRLEKLRDIGLIINGKSDYYTPSITYAICLYKNVWYFGVLIKNNADWLKHKKKHYSFSNSICLKIAKTLVSIASKADKSTTLLDACCGVGTVLLEAYFSGFDIEGCEIKFKACNYTRANLAHYKYTANVYCSDIKNHNKKYGAAIIDLPYNLYAYSNDSITSNIIASTAKLTERIVIVSISDIEPLINKAGLKVNDFCTVEKRGKSAFKRKIWVCEKEN